MRGNIMKRTLALAMTVLVLGAYARAQTIYSVHPSTKDNRIDLTISNRARTATAQGVEVRAVQYPDKITFKNAVQTIESVPPLGERTASFTFDVARPTKPDNGSTDTLKFLITDRNGSTWEKSIVVIYALPAEFALEQNFPNPFNPSTTIYYQLPAESRVAIHVYNVLGQLVTTLVDEVRPAGYHEAHFDAVSLPSGVYFYRMIAGTYIATKKMMIIK